jgi:hypothetical protein
MRWGFWTGGLVVAVATLATVAYWPGSPPPRPDARVVVHTARDTPVTFVATIGPAGTSGGPPVHVEKGPEHGNIGVFGDGVHINYSPLAGFTGYDVLMVQDAFGSSASEAYTIRIDVG